MSDTHADSQAPSRVVLVDDHTLVRQTIAKIVGAQAGFRVVGEAGHPDEALAVVATSRADLVVLDIGMPGGTGLDLAARLRQTAPWIRLMFLTMHDDDASIARAIDLGADGYVLKTASTEELIQALRAVAAGGSYLSPGIARRVMDRAGGKQGAGLLTQRELEILRLLSDGARPAEVAARLFVSLKTVRNHLASIYAKLGVQTGTQAVAEAFRRGLVSAGDAS